jgi:16S rRNA (cytidine1402-2'-O)-methyltransferase
VIAALVASGLPGDSWRFAGFLPRKRGELRDVLARAGEATLVAFESPRRVPATLRVLAELDHERPVAVCRELTKVHEEVVRGTAADLAERYRDAPPKGEVVLVVGPAAGGGEVSGEPPEESVDAVRRLVDAGAKPRVAAAAVGELTGVRVNDLYRTVTKRTGE